MSEQSRVHNEGDGPDAAVERPRRRSVARRVARAVAAAVGALVVLAALAVFVLTQTGWGHERVRRFAERSLAARTGGVARIGGVSGNLLRGARLRDVSLADSAGGPLFSARRVEVDYALLPLLFRREVRVSRLEVVEPTVVVARPPGGEWNWSRLGGGDSRDDATGGRARRQMWLRDVAVSGGRVLVVMPWAPDSGLGAAERDSALARALAGGTRERIEPWRGSALATADAGGAGGGGAGGGGGGAGTNGNNLGGAPPQLQYAAGALTARHPTSATRTNPSPDAAAAAARLVRVIELRDVAARVPWVRLASPDSAGRAIQVASLSMTALPFRAPAAEVRDAAGTVHLTSDSTWWRGVRLALPATRLTSEGVRRAAGGRLELAVRADTIALADWRWLYPRLPAEGGGRLLLLSAAAGGSAATDIAVRGLSLRTGAASLDGDAAVRIAGGVRTLRDTRLSFERVSTCLIEQLVPAFDAPRDGEATGRVTLAGRADSLVVDGDVVYDDARAGRSRVAAAGELGFGAVTRARALRVRLSPLQLALVPGAPLGGSLSGAVRVDGSSAGGWRGEGELAHAAAGGGARSRAAGRAAVGAGADPTVDVDVRLLPLSLTTLGTLAPGAGLRGSASGPLRVTGRMSDLAATSRLALAEGGGEVALRGRLRRDGGAPDYELAVETMTLDAAAASARAPRTALTAAATLRGRGSPLDTRRGRAEMTLHVAPSEVGGVPVDTVELRARVADGLLTLDTADARALSARATLGGTFGLDAARGGRLGYALRVDSLERLRRWIATDTGVVLPRPLRQARLLARARADSARAARATRIERLATGGPDVELPEIDAIPPLPRDSLAGTLSVEGSADGNLRRLTTRGALAGRDLVALGRAARGARAEYAWSMDRDAPPAGDSARAALVLGVVLDTVQAEGFAFDRLDARLAARDGGAARGELRVRQDEHRDYAARFDLAPRGAGARLALLDPKALGLALREAELRLDTLGARFGDVRWGLARRGSAVRWAPGSVAVDSLELRSSRGGRLFADGTVAERRAALRVEADGVELADVAAALQADTSVTGVASLRASLEGTPDAPRLSAEGALARADVRGTAIPDVRVWAEYAARRLVARATLLDSAGSPALATVDARLPVDLALRRAADAGPRFARRDSLSVDVRADSLPLSRVPPMTTAVGDLEGVLRLALGLRGTADDPALTGGAALSGGSVTVRATGARVTGVAASLRAAGDSVVVDSIVGRSHGPVRVAGAIALPELLRPVAALRVEATDLEVLDNENGQMRADLAADVSGPPDDLLVRGRGRLRNSVLTLAGPGRKLVRRYAPGDPRVFTVFDTAPAPRAYPVPPRPDSGPNFRAELGLRFEHDNWFRTPPDANVEYFSAGELRGRIDRRRGVASAEGVVRIRNGRYVYLAREFELERGSLSLTLAPGVLPHFQMVGVHEIWLPGREPLEIRLLNSGPSRGPRITLETSTVFPMPQRDIITHLSFGRAWTSLLQQAGTSLAGDGPLDGVLSGEIGAMARRQQTAAALGVLLHDLGKGAVRSAGSDLFSATPSDVRPELANSEAAGAGGTVFSTGWFLNRRTLARVELRPMAAPPGLRLEHRMRRGFLLEGGLEPRFLLRTPRGLLDREPARAVAFGALLWKEWEW